MDLPCLTKFVEWFLMEVGEVFFRRWVGEDMAGPRGRQWVMAESNLTPKIDVNSFVTLFFELKPFLQSRKNTWPNSKWWREYMRIGEKKSRKTDYNGFIHFNFENQLSCFTRMVPDLPSRFHWCRMSLKGYSTTKWYKRPMRAPGPCISPIPNWERFCIKVELRVSNPPFITIGWSKRIRKICCEISVKNFSQLNLLKSAQFTRKKGRWGTFPIPKKETGQWKKTCGGCRLQRRGILAIADDQDDFQRYLDHKEKMIKSKDSKGSFHLLHGRTYTFNMFSVHNTIHNLNFFLYMWVIPSWKSYSSTVNCSFSLGRHGYPHQVGQRCRWWRWRWRRRRWWWWRRSWWRCCRGDRGEEGQGPMLPGIITPWKINMDHNHGGLEDHVPFQMGDL